MKSIIQKPGYHLKAKYDLHSLRKRLEKGNKHAVDAELNLTAMVDMFSMLIIFLLMNFSATGEVFFISKNIKLPEAKHARVLENLPLISITTKSVSLDAEKMGDNPLHYEESDSSMTILKDKLRKLKIMQQTLRPDQPFEGKVNVQADENVPIFYIKRVMVNLIEEGWMGINFAVRPPEE